MTIASKYKHSLSLYLLKYSIIWTTRRRKEFLDEKLADVLLNLLVKIAEDNETEIIKCIVKPNYVHLIVSAPPELSPLQIVYRFKNQTSSFFRNKYPELRKLPSIWTTDYFISTNELTEDIVDEYIKNQNKS